jgi:YHS domain-containing protein
MQGLIMKITAIILLMVTLALAGQAVALNNTICPVSQAKIGNMGKPVTVTYKGKIVQLCCTGCVSAFTKDPEKYMKHISTDSTHSHH